MADTIGGEDFGKCEDCGKDHAGILHWGPLVPNGKRTVLCGKCMTTRDKWMRTHRDPLPVPMPPEAIVEVVTET